MASSIGSVHSVVIVLRVLASVWARVPESLRNFFEEFPEVRPAHPSPMIEGRPKRRGERTMQSTQSCGLKRFFQDLVDAGFQTFSVSCFIEDGVAKLRFMLCPGNEVIWDGRPFPDMQRACEDACSMAAYRSEMWDNPYTKDEEDVPEDWRAWNVNADNANLFFGPDGKEIGRPSCQLVIGHDGRPVLEETA